MKKNSGFTLIELMLSMTFVAVLLLAIALTFIQMATIYNRGMTVKEVNQSARDISDDLRRSFAMSQVFSINADGSESSDYVRAKAGSVDVGGRLCTGTDTYIWNYGSAIRPGSVSAEATRTLNAGGGEQEPIRFVRFPDMDKRYCVRSSATEFVLPHITAVDARDMIDLLDVGDHDLALHEFKVMATNEAQDVSTGQRLYTVTYTIGSGAPSAIDLTANPMKCKDPGDPNANITYCNVQKFTIVLRVGNTVN